jgi:DNA-binding MarR family transcriptional regulator
MIDMVDGSAWLNDDEQRAWRSFVEMQHALERHLGQHLQRESGVSAPDFEILVNLSEATGGRMRAGELAAATQWEKSRLSHHLGRMEKRGLVARVPGDARYPEVELTAAGRAAIGGAAPKNAAWVRKLFIDVLGPERLEALREMSDDVRDAVDTHRAECGLDSSPRADA